MQAIYAEYIAELVNMNWQLCAAIPSYNVIDIWKLLAHDNFFRPSE